MQVPEKLALIGGSILLSSTLIFTLKSQASSIIPHIGHSIGNVYQDITDTNAEHGILSFNDAFKNAQKNGWTTGTWGTSRYYVDSDMNMHIGAGQLSGKLYNTLGDSLAYRIKTINLDEDAQAPQNSNNLFTGHSSGGDPNASSNNSIQSINGLEHLDTSQVTTMNDMFYLDKGLSNDLNINNWNTSNVQDMTGMFGQTNISHLDVHSWDVRKVYNLAWTFTGDSSLQSLDLSGWHTDNLTSDDSMFSTNDGKLRSLDLSNFDNSKANTRYFFGGAADWDIAPNQLSQITLGSKTQPKTKLGLSGTWQNGDQTLNGSELSASGIDGEPSHPGTWVKQ